MKRMYLLVPIMLVVSLMILSMALPASANRPFQYGDLIAIMDDGRVLWTMDASSTSHRPGSGSM